MHYFHYCFSKACFSQVLKVPDIGSRQSDYVKDDCTTSKLFCFSLIICHFYDLSIILYLLETIEHCYLLCLLPDCMFICKMMQSDWLDYGTWTIYTFLYRRSGPFIWLSIKVKTQDFWEDDRETVERGREKFVTFGKLSVNFRKLSGKNLKQ